MCHVSCGERWFGVNGWLMSFWKKFTQYLRVIENDIGVSFELHFSNLGELISNKVDRLIFDASAKT